LDPLLVIDETEGMYNLCAFVQIYVAYFFFLFDPDQANTEGEKKEKRKKGPTYQDHEDAQLSSSWVEVSEDPSVGTDQAGTRFWDRISKCYHNAIPQPPRPIGSLKGRWQLISHGVSKFAGCVKHIDQLNPSGATSEDRLTKALALFSELQGKTFGFLQCYNILTSSPKWSDYLQDMNTKTVEGPKKKKKRARSPSSEAPPLTSEQASDTETPSETPDRPEPERPGGKKKGKSDSEGRGYGGTDNEGHGNRASRDRKSIQAPERHISKPDSNDAEHGRCSHHE
jgi:hypothetical protein